MNIYKTELQGVLVIEPNIFEDDRGFFYESYKKSIKNWMMQNQNLLTERGKQKLNSK